MGFIEDILPQFYAIEDPVWVQDVTYEGTTFKAHLKRNAQIVLDGVESTGPVLRCMTADIASFGLEHGSVLSVGGMEYVVTGISENDSGETFLSIRLNDE
jgi:hypothetical protein